MAIVAAATPVPQPIAAEQSAGATRRAGELSCVADAELQVGATGYGVACLQLALLARGIYSDISAEDPALAERLGQSLRTLYRSVASGSTAMGTFDQATADALASFQALNPPLAADGRAGPATLNALGIYSGRLLAVDSSTAVAGGARCTADAHVERGERSLSAQCVQATLRDLGFYTGAVDGAVGAGTVDAIKRFQQATPPLEVDGIAGPRTLAALGIWSGRNERDHGSASVGPWPAPITGDPQWWVNPQGIPVYGNHGACTLTEANIIAAEFQRDGADVATQQWAVYIASREASCRFATVNNNPATRDDSHCTFQLNVLSGTFEPSGELGRHGWTPDSVKESLQACADAASDLWVHCGRGPWLPPYSCAAPWKALSG